MLPLPGGLAGRRCGARPANRRVENRGNNCRSVVGHTESNTQFRVARCDSKVATMTRWDSVERAVADIAAGKAVVVIDDEERENEGDLIFAAEKATPELVAFMVRYTSGYLCVPLDGAICDKLGLLPMFAVNQDKHGTAYTVTVDAKNGVGTGISASDRATTMRLLADPGSVADDFTRPGHVVPLRAK